MESTGYCPTGKVERLLLATDGTEYSEGAVREAISLAKGCSSSLFAMTVAETTTDYETLSREDVEKAIFAQAEGNLDKVRARASESGVDCTTIIVQGDDPHDSIVEHATEKRADMIVIGRRGAKGLAKLLMGEVAAKVVGNAPCDVLVVPRSARIEYKRVLAATDGSAHSLAAVRRAIEIAKRGGGTVVAVSAMRNEDERKEAEACVGQAAEMARKEGVAVETATPTGRSFDVIVETAGGRSVDLIVMGTYGKSGIKKALMGSATEKVIGNAGCAVLVVKAQ
ncbi:MAG: universal stress protein [Nitrospirae bacterium]|nr:universal stress protein [Nitrospirota bacterium]